MTTTADTPLPLAPVPPNLERFRVYVAGPISAASKELVLANCEAAVSVALELSKIGFTVICVHALAYFEISRGNFESDVQGKRLEQVLLQDFVLVKDSNAVVTVQTDYTKSSGTLSEVVLAKNADIPVYDYPTQKHVGFAQLLRQASSDLLSMGWDD